MTTLRIRLFGSLQLLRGDREQVNLTPIARSMFAFLLLYRCRGSNCTGPRRDILTSELWDNFGERDARRCLSTTLWRLRRELEPEGVASGTYLVTSANDEVGFNFAADHWLDVRVFEQQVKHGLALPVNEMDADDAQRLEEAVDLYVGELLEDFYADWVLRERERLNVLYLKCLAHLMRYYEHNGEWDNGLICGQKILDIDPLREQVHRCMMTLYLKSGQPILAIQQYRRCERILLQELGIQPRPATQALLAEVMSSIDSSTVGEPVANAEEPVTLSQVRQQLKVAMETLNQAQAELQQLKQIVSNIVQ